MLQHNEIHLRKCDNKAIRTDRELTTENGGVDVKLTAIMDNHRSEQKALTAEHGLSFLLDTGTTKILFDFGAGRAAYDNAVKLNPSNFLKQDRFTSETMFLKSIINVHPDRKFYLSTLTEKRSCNAAPFFV